MCMINDDDFESLEESHVSFTDSAQQSYMMRCEHNYWMKKFLRIGHYLVFSAVCFIVWQLVGAAFFTRYAPAVMSAYSEGWTIWSGFMLFVWGLTSIIWGIVAASKTEEHPEYDLIETPK